MSREERRSAPGLLARQARTDAPLAAIVAIVVAVAAFLVSAGPGALAEVADREVRHTLAEYPAVRHDLTAAAWFGYPNGRSQAPSDADSGLDAITTTVDGVVDRLIPPLASVLGSPDWAVTTTRGYATLRDDPLRATTLVVGLTAAPRWEELVSYVEGAPPRPWAQAGAEASDPALRTAVEVALSSTAAQQMDVGVGDVVDIGTTPVVVAGLFEPAEPADAFWQHRPRLRDAAKGRADDGRTSYTADALIDPRSTVGLQKSFVTARIDAWYPLLIDEVAFRDAPHLAEQIRQLSARGAALPSGEVLLFEPRLASDLDEVTTRVTLTTALLGLLVAGPLGVVLAVLALAAGSIAERRSPALALARARGGSGIQLRTAMLLEGALLAVPAAAIGAATAFAVTGGRTTVPDLWPAVLIAATPPLLFALAVPRPAGGQESNSSVRWVTELLVVGLAGASLFLLFRRGIAPGRAGIDPLLAAAPLLIAAAVTVGVLRLYPGLMTAVQRASARGPGAVRLVGSARAVRTPSLGFAAAFALIVGVSMAVFSAGMAASLAGALAAAAETSVPGEAAALDAGHPLIVALFLLLAAAAALPLLFCVLAIVLAVIAAAASRNRSVGVLRVLGFSAAQVRGLVAWELVPVVIVAIVAGVGLGVAEVFVLSAAPDLASFVGAEGSAAPRVDPAVTAGIAIAFAAATALAAAIATSVARRRTPGSTIRMGTE